MEITTAHLAEGRDPSGLLQPGCGLIFPIDRLRHARKPAPKSKTGGSLGVGRAGFGSGLCLFWFDFLEGTV